MAPSASRNIDVARSVSGDRVVACAESVIAGLARDNGHWNTRFTLRDPENGTIETGDFADNSIVGFRVRVVFDPGRLGNQVDIDLKGTGLYFTDLGADEAIGVFASKLERCLA